MSPVLTRRRTVESTVAATAGATAADAVAAGTEVEAPLLVATAGGGAAVVVPVTVDTVGAVSVRETVVAVLVSVEPADPVADAELTTLPDETMLDEETINAVLLAWLAMLEVNDVVAGLVVVCPLPDWHEARAMPRAAASLQMADEDQVMVKKVTTVKEMK